MLFGSVTLIVVPIHRMYNLGTQIKAFFYLIFTRKTTGHFFHRVQYSVAYRESSDSYPEILTFKNLAFFSQN